MHKFLGSFQLLSLASPGAEDKSADPPVWAEETPRRRASSELVLSGRFQLRGLEKIENDIVIAFIVNKSSLVS